MPTLDTPRILYGVAIIAGLALGPVSAPLAQEVNPAPAPSRLAQALAPVPTGDVVRIVDRGGTAFTGMFIAVSRDVVVVRSKGEVRVLNAADIQRVEWRRSDSPATGALIGAAIGASYGVYWMIVDPNECDGLCAEDYALMGIGALLGGLIDHAVHKHVRVYEAPGASRRTATVLVGPLVAADRKGVQAVVRF